MVVVDPLRVQYMVAKLSVESFVVRSRMSKHWAAHSCWKRLPASSRSEFVDVSCGIVEGHETVANVLGEDDAP